MPRLRRQRRSNWRQPISRKNWERERLSSLLSSLLQSAIHLFKATFRISVEAFRHEWYQQACELLVLNESDTFFVECFDCETVFAVKEAGYQESPEPAHLTVRLNVDHFGLEGHDSSPSGSKLDVKLCSSSDLAAHLSNEGVPFGELGKISQYLPDPLCRGFNLYLSRDLFHF